MDRIIDLLDAAAKFHPIKALAEEIGKAESTLRNELTGQPGYKLGLRTSLLILKKTGDLRALDEIEAMVGRVAFAVPRASGSMAPVMELAAAAMRELGEDMKEIGQAMADGVITPKEAGRCIAEIDETIAALARLRGHLEHYK